MPLFLLMFKPSLVASDNSYGFARIKAKQLALIELPSSVFTFVNTSTSGSPPKNAKQLAFY